MGHVARPRPHQVPLPKVHIKGGNPTRMKTVLVALKWIAIIAVIATLTVLTGGFAAHAVLILIAIKVAVSTSTYIAAGSSLLPIGALVLSVIHARNCIKASQEKALANSGDYRKTNVSQEKALANSGDYRKTNVSLGRDFQQFIPAFINQVEEEDSSTVMQQLLSRVHIDHTRDVIRELNKIDPKLGREYLITVCNSTDNDADIIIISPSIMMENGVDFEKWHSFFKSLQRGSQVSINLMKTCRPGLETEVSETNLNIIRRTIPLVQRLTCTQ